MNMIERVARAAHNFNVAANPKINWEDMPDHYKDTWRRLAKAAIEAMKEPTEEMLLGCNSSLVHAELKQIYTSMIEAALKEE